MAIPTAYGQRMVSQMILDNPESYDEGRYAMADLLFGDQLTALQYYDSNRASIHNDRFWSMTHGDMVDLSHAVRTPGRIRIREDY